MAKQLPESANRAERILAYMMIAMLAVAVVSFFALIAGTFAGMTSAAFSVGVWPAVVIAPLVALPLAIVLIIVLVVVSARRRAAAAAPTAAARRPLRGK